MSTGVIASRPIYPTSSGINPALDSRSFNLFPYAGGAMASGAKAGTRTFIEPVIPSRAVSGGKATSFGDDWFNRIHITPALMLLGNLVSGLTKTFYVWNAWLGVARVLETITGAGTSGITMTPPSSTPLAFKPNAELAFAVGISLDGAPVIDAIYTFLFDDSEAPKLEITGNRITAWALSPNWDKAVEERIEFKTDVLRAWSGAEQRRALRIAPRRFFDFDVMMQSRDRRFLEAQMFAWSTRVWALPIWPDGQRLSVGVAAGDSSVTCDTVNRDFVAGGMAIFASSAAIFEVVQVLGVTGTSISLKNPVQNTWPAQTRFYPARAARLEGFPRISRANADVSSASVGFRVVEPCDWASATGLPTYRGNPVLENSPSEGELEMTYSRDAFMVDNETGALTIDDRAGVGMPTQSHDWFIQGRSARAAFRGLLYLLKGRQGEIWVPTYQLDLKLVSSVNTTQTTIDVEGTGYTLYMQGQVNRQDIRVELINGTILYRRITGSAVLDVNTERLSIDSTLGVNIAITDVRRISYMALSRLGSDSIQLDHHTAADGLATARTPWQALNHNV